MRIPAGTQLGEYEIVALIGAGGMGEVYRARDLRLRREVAIKVLGAALSHDAESMTRFRREAEAASALNHPHIVTVHGFGEATLPDGSQCSYMVVELIDGATLRSLIHEPSITTQRLLGWCVQVAEGLAKAHAAGIVHRDLKPDNVMVSNDGYAKVLDFGLAKLHGPAAAGPADATAPLYSDSKTVVGTAGYMAPEQVRGKGADARSDIFSFGCILFEAVLRRRAFEGDSSFDVLSKIVHDEAVMPDDVPEPLARIVRRCLAKNPEERYQSARDLAVDLRDSITTTSARTIPAAPPLQKARKRLIAGIIASAVLATLGVFALRQTPEVARIDSLVVLPFGNSDPELEYVSDGVTDALLSDLSRVSGLRVIARTTAFKYRETTKALPVVGRELNVDGIIAGEVRRNGGLLLVDTELVDASDGTRVWGRRYERDARDMLTLQREIASDVTRALRGEPLAPPERVPTESGAAYDLYLKGRYFWNKRTPDSVAKALALFNEAIESDPTYARAYSGVADAYIARMQLTGSWAQSCDRAFAAARRALELDPSIAEAHASLGYLHLSCTLELQDADRVLRRALQLNPNYAVAQHWMGVYLVNVGRAEEGLTHIREAARLDPFSTQIQTNVGFALVHARRPVEAVRAVEEALELDANAAYPHHMRGYVALESGDTPRAIEEFRKAIARNFPVSLPFLAYAYAQSGDAAAARAMLAEIEKQTSDVARAPALRAGTHFLLGERERAFALLEEAYAKRDYWLSAMRVSPPYTPLRGEPEFQALLARVSSR